MTAADSDEAHDDSVRPASIEDLEALLDCWVALVEHGRQHGLHIRSSANRTVARETLSAAIADGRAFVATPPNGESESGIVGFCSLSLGGGGFERDAVRGVIDNLYVEPAARGHGLGSALLETGEDRLRELGAEVVSVETMAVDAGARSFYEERGYAPHRLTVEKRVETSRNE